MNSERDTKTRRAGHIESCIHMCEHRRLVLHVRKPRDLSDRVILEELYIGLSPTLAVPLMHRLGIRQSLRACSDIQT
jgi:hypothetical protein